MTTLKDTAFYNLQKNLDIEYVKTGKKDWFHSGYRLLDYWTTKEKIQELIARSDEYHKQLIKEILGDFEK